MIREIILYECTSCGSTNIVKNGKNRYGQKEQILATYQERPSMRGIQRIYGISRNTLSSWLKKAKCCDLKDTLVAAREDDVLELDEVWSFVYCSTNKRWLWTALCRCTLQIVAFVSGDHSAKTCAKLWQKIPASYKHCHTFSDFWDAYAKVFPKATHRSVGKDTGETCHMERWNCTLRQRLARFVRKTLSFSKSDHMHQVVLKWFIADYNCSRISEA